MHLSAPARFADLASAGRALAPLLAAYAGAADATVLGIVRGGVPGAVEVARALRLPLDVVLLRRLLAPRGPAELVCAASVAGVFLPDAGVEPARADPAQRAFLEEALAAFGERVRLCRGAQPPRDLAGRTVVLYDNGVHTGGTLRIALRAVRRLAPSRVVVAVPVAAPAAVGDLLPLADEVVCLSTPEPFGHVGLWHARHDVPPVDEIADRLREAGTGP